MDLKGNKSGMIVASSLAVVLYLLLNGPDAFAAEGLSPGRKLWDNILLWVNFGILAFVFLRYAKKPLMGYLRGVQTEVEEELNEIKTRFNEAKSLMDVEEGKLKNIQARVDEIRENMLELGEREKERIIEEGRIAAEKMIQNARDYAQYRIDLARKALADEMVDLAFYMVEEKLTKGISEEENENLVNQFVSELEATKPLSD